MLTIRIAYSPISWGIINTIDPNSPVTYPAYLLQIKKLGYVGTDLGPSGFLHPHSEKLNEDLEKIGIILASAFISINFLNPEGIKNKQKSALEAANMIKKYGDAGSRLILAGELVPGSIRYKNAGRIRPEMGLLPFQWSKYARGVEELARIVRDETGIRTVYHHYCGTAVETPGETGMLLDYTDPDLVGVCLDTGHYAFAGGDPIRIFRSFGDRIQFVHFKDMNPRCALVAKENNWDFGESIQNGIFCELGSGFVDFSAILGELDNIDYDGWIVIEQDLAPGSGDPLQNARQNRAYLSRLGY